MKKLKTSWFACTIKFALLIYVLFLKKYVPRDHAHDFASTCCLSVVMVNDLISEVVVKFIVEFRLSVIILLPLLT